MNKEEKNDASRETSCPVCTLVKGMSDMRSRYSGFFTHLFNARIEFLQAFRSLIDQRISCLEHRRDKGGEAKKATKIEVE